jgi:hypothetical protein
VGQVREEVAVSCAQTKDGQGEFSWEGGLCSTKAVAVWHRVGFRFRACHIPCGLVCGVLLSYFASELGYGDRQLHYRW